MKALFLVLSLVSSQAFAGVWNNQIECSNKSGSIKLIGNIPGDATEFTLKATIKSKAKVNSLFTPSMELTNKIANIAVVEALEQKIFTVKAVDKEEMSLLELYAYPSSLRVSKGARGSSTRFLGHLTVSNENGMEKAVVSCKTWY